MFLNLNIPKQSVITMNARQEHGFLFENYIISKYKLQKSSVYHDEYDAYLDDMPFQIKYIKYKSSIELGSYMRNKNKKEDFTLFVGFWKENKDTLYKEYRIDINANTYTKMFNMSKQKEQDMFSEFESITNKREEDAKWKEFISKYRQKNNVINLRFKRDHKSQKRIQCAIPFKNFQVFCENFNFKESVMCESIVMSESITGLKRNNNEQYYTKKDIANDLITKLKNVIDFNKIHLIVEPSAGQGVFLDELQHENVPILAYDIHPKHPVIIKQDFLEIPESKLKGALVIGNPPFGKQSSLAKKFIKKCKDSSYIAFILPRSFLKPSMYNCFPSDFHKIYEYLLPKNSFIFNETSYDVPCVFLVYEKRDYIRKKNIPETPNENYSYTIPKDSYTISQNSIAFKRVGGNAGQFRYENINALSKQSHIFIKFNMAVTPQIKEKLNNIEWQTNNTVGPKSVCKQELTIALNKLNLKE